MPSQVTLVKCEILDKDLARRYDTNEVSFDIARARRLVAKGVVRILPEEEIVSSVKTLNSPIPFTYTDSHAVKIAWVQDNSKEGGAELSNKTVIHVGQSLGYDIALVTPDQFSRRVLSSADFIIINNIFEFSPEQMDDIRFCIYERRIPYIKYDHDYRELARINLSQQLFLFSRANVFLSPVHLERSCKVLGIGNQNNITLPLAIDTNLFRPIESAVREPNSVLIPCYRKGKGTIAEFITKNSQFTYTIIGQGDQTFQDRIVKYVGAGQVGQMPILYSTHEFMLHLPVEHWAGERIYFESILCGCKPLINEETVGHASWKFPLESIRNELEKAPFTFWREVCRLLNN